MISKKKPKKTTKNTTHSHSNRNPQRIMTSISVSFPQKQLHTDQEVDFPPTSVFPEKMLQVSKLQLQSGTK